MPSEKKDAMRQAGSDALSVSAAVALAKGALEGIKVRIVGEVSEVSAKRGYKAVYFTVKDEGAALPCMMWNNRYQAAGIELRVGMLVEIAGRFTVYAAKGRMNFDVSSITPAGEGMLRMQVAALARKLEAEGLTSPDRKRPLPTLPSAIGVVTSPRGAAIHDVLRTLRRRYPLARVLVAGVPVEGDRAPAALIEGMQRVAAGGAEVMLVVRGGGSFEDLMPFNDEGLARAIAAAPVPVVTGIGHEPDTSIADMVADVRASTPTAAAEAVAPDAASLEARIEGHAASLSHAMGARIADARARTERFAAMPLFQEPQRLFEGECQHVDDLSGRLHQAIPHMIEEDRRRLMLARASLASMGPHLTARDAARADALAGRLRLQGPSLTKRFASQVGVAAAQLESLSPLGVVSRGYAIVRDANGRIVKSVKAVDAGSSVSVAVADGTMNCTVDDVDRKEMSMKSGEES